MTASSSHSGRKRRRRRPGGKPGQIGIIKHGFRYFNIKVGKKSARSH